MCILKNKSYPTGLSRVKSLKYDNVTSFGQIYIAVIPICTMIKNNMGSIQEKKKKGSNPIPIEPNSPLN